MQVESYDTFEDIKMFLSPVSRLGANLKFCHVIMHLVLRSTDHKVTKKIRKFILKMNVSLVVKNTSRSFTLV